VVPKCPDSSGMVPKCLETLRDHTRTVLVPKCPGPEVSVKRCCYRVLYLISLWEENLTVKVD